MKKLMVVGAAVLAVSLLAVRAFADDDDDITKRHEKWIGKVMLHAHRQSANAEATQTNPPADADGTDAAAHASGPGAWLHRVAEGRRRPAAARPAAARPANYDDARRRRRRHGGRAAAASGAP